MYTTCIDKVHVHFDNIIVIGDLNYDLFKPNKSQPLHTICDIFDFINLIKTPTCFMKDAHSSLLDVILINRPSILYNTTHFTCGICDWHNVISMTSNFNYCPLIWHFCSQSSTTKLEKNQERALRLIYNDYSSTHLLKTANTEHLQVKRIKEMACELFKFLKIIF